MRVRLFLTLTLTASTVAASDPKPMTVDDLWAVRRVGAPVLSPDGRFVAYTVTGYDMEEDRGNADIWISPLAGGPARQLTTNRASDTSPAWSPDGTRIVFVSRREGDGAKQLYVIRVDGGEAERATDMPLSVSDPKWLPDGKRIAFVSPVIAGAEAPEATKKALAARDKSKVRAHVTDNRLYRFWDRWLTEGEYPHVFVLDLETRKVTDLLPGSKRYFELMDGSGAFDVSPDGSTIVFSANRTPEPYPTLDYDIFSVPAGGGEVKDLTPTNPGDDVRPVFSPDGKRVAYGLQRRGDGWPDYTRLAVLDMTTGKTTVLTEGWENSVADWAWTADGENLVFHAEVRARANLYRIPARGGSPQEVHHGGTTSGAAPTRDRQVVFSETTLSRPPELAVVGLDGSRFRSLTTLNDALLARMSLGRVEEVTFAGANRDEVQMFLVYPPGYEPGRKYPLLQLIHGGPVGTFGDAFHLRWNAHAFAAPGYMVALVNFHGSSSFGQPFVESILGAHPDKPFTDVMMATDFLIARGQVDPDRMAAAGGSYGGFLVNWIAGHTDRFQALVSHAGVYSLLGQSASDTSYGRQHSYGGYPFTDLANVERWSPNRFAAAFRTPMLITHGERDFRVPVTQGLELYGVLTAKGVPARLVVYPDENHWVLKGQNSRHWYGEVLAWLAHYLK
ncbi:MAG TPA: S9 family peptidase [Vicinamibacteria bacterium]|jgi:dipeptidyl aminopeptidase/acylaminoacyl peptidase|nr:S9 family peptidase [Vicinamibacteria bacterium]